MAFGQIWVAGWLDAGLVSRQRDHTNLFLCNLSMLLQSLYCVELRTEDKWSLPGRLSVKGGHALSLYSRRTFQK